MKTIETNLQEMFDALLSTQKEFTKFKEGNKSAGTRLRKSMQDIKAMAQTVRVEVQEIKNAVPA